MPAAKNNLIIIDTNLWISFLLTRDFSKLDKLLSKPSCTLLFSKELYEEFQNVAQRPKFRKYFSANDLNDLLGVMKNIGQLVHVFSDVAACRDPKDNFLLALAKDGNATHLLTGDKDLLDMKRFGRTRILSMTDYLLKQ